MRSTSLIASGALVALLCAASRARVAAQENYPIRPVLLTHGFAAGGNGDVVSRIVGEALSPRLGQPVIIEPRPGAGGNTASARLAKAEPDGYTLISLTGGHAVSAAIYKSLPFDPLDDFQMVSVYGHQAFMLAVRKDSTIKTVADLIAAAKAAPGKLTYSSVGVGSTQHLAGELLCAMAGIEMTHIPYRGGERDAGAGGGAPQRRAAGRPRRSADRGTVAQDRHGRARKLAEGDARDGGIADCEMEEGRCGREDSAAMTPIRRAPRSPPRSTVRRAMSACRRST